VATTILIKKRQTRYIPITLLPLIWLVAVNFTAAYEKIFDPNPRIGFLSQAHQLAVTGANVRLIFNFRLDAFMTALLVLMVTLIVIESTREWLCVLSGRKQAAVKEAPFVITRLAVEEQG
jgi:carbon starvation protein